MVCFPCPWWLEQELMCLNCRWGKIVLDTKETFMVRIEKLGNKLPDDVTESSKQCLCEGLDN